MSGEYKYDAFISYRHLAPDKPVAEKLQKLLEAYVPPKSARDGQKAKKLRLFRDETELPTSNDLGGDIRQALEQSRFLVVICSERFEESKWCMQEVAFFQALHGGSNRQILTLFVGDPDRPPVFPEPLRYEPKTVLLPDGTETVVREEIEPLAANVSAKTQRQALQRLKVEFLRIAAPLFGCGFDDLFQREQRRRSRRRFSFAAAAAAALMVVAVFGTVAVQQNRQIRYKNAESLVNQSRTLENGGNLYDAMDAVARALPEKPGEAPLANSAVEQAVSLTGAYEPELFTATQKFSFPAAVRDLCLLNGGRTLLVKTEEGTSLWDVDAGEQIVFFAADRYTVAYFHDAAVEGELSTEWYAAGQVSVTSIGNKGFMTSRYKGVREETGIEEDAVFCIDKEEQRICRVSPADGTVVWAKEGEYSYTSVVSELPRSGGLPVIVTERPRDDSGFTSFVKSVCVLDFASGEEIARVGYDALEERIEDFSDIHFNGVFFADPLLLLLYRSDLYVYRAEGGTTSFLYVIPAVVTEETDFVHPIKDVFLCDGTLLLLGKEKENIPSSVTFFSGYDLADGSLKWSYTRKAPVGESKARMGVFRPSAAPENGGTVAFGVVDSEVFVVDPQTGEDAGSFSLLRAMRDVYYAENGVVFVIDDSGQEVVFSVNEDVSFFDRTLSDVYMVRSRNFRSEIGVASYVNNRYAVTCGGRENEAVIYAAVENHEKRLVFRTEEKAGVYDTALNEDGSLLLTRNYARNEAYVINAADGKTVCVIPLGDDAVDSVCFLNRDTLAVCYYHKTAVFHALTGELTAEYEYDKAVVVPGEPPVLFWQSDETIHAVSPGGEEETVFDLEEQKKQPADGDATLTYFLYGFFVSPSGNRVGVLYDCGEPFGEKEMFLLVTDRKTGEKRQFGAPAMAYSSDLISEVWSADENELYLLTEKEAAGYRFGSGETIFSRENADNLKGMVRMEDQLFVIDFAGNLRRIDLSDGEITQERILLSVTSFYGGLRYVPAGKGQGFLCCGKNAWLIDVGKQEIVFHVQNFSGYDPATETVYTSRYDSVHAYPLASGYALRQKAEAILRGGE